MIRLFFYIGYPVRAALFLLMAIPITLVCLFEPSLYTLYSELWTDLSLRRAL